MTGSKSEETVWCVEFDPVDVEWVEQGDDPYLDSEDEDNRIETDVISAVESYFKFPNTTHGSDYFIRSKLMFKAKKEIGGGTQSVTTYIHNGEGEENEGSFEITTTDYAWYTVWISSVDTWTQFNAIKAKFVKFHSGNELSVVYVDNFADQGGWLREGDSPYLNNSTANYIYSKTNGETIGDFDFATVSGYESGGTLQVECIAEGNDYFMVELYVLGTGWVDIGDIYPGDSIYAWESIDVSGWLDSDAKFNAAKVRFTYYKVGGASYVYIRKCRMTLYTTGARKVSICAAKLVAEYYEGGEEIIKDPTQYEDGTPAWNLPVQGLTLDGNETNASVVTAKEIYKTYEFPANLEVIYEVWIYGTSRRSATGDPDTMKWCISPDGGSSWHDTARYPGTSPQEYKIDFTSDENWTPEKLSDTNLRTRIWSGSTGCLMGGCEVGLWNRSVQVRMANKDQIEVITVALAYDLWQKFKEGLIQIKDLPKIMGWDWNEGFGESVLEDIIKHENVPCYHLQCRLVGGDNVKDIKGSETHLVWECFKGYTRVVNLELGDHLVGLFWNNELEDYELRPMEVILKEYLGLHDVYEIITDKAHIFGHSTMQKVIKW